MQLAFPCRREQHKTHTNSDINIWHLQVSDLQPDVVSCCQTHFLSRREGSGKQSIALSLGLSQDCGDSTAACGSNDMICCPVTIDISFVATAAGCK